MRTISGAGNRAALVVGGLLMILAALWVAFASPAVQSAWPPVSRWSAPAEATPAGITSAHQGWLLPAVLALSVLVTVAGIILLVRQIPSSPSRSILRITDQDDRLLGSLAPEVLERALVEAVEDLPGVVQGSARLGGSAGAPWIQATVTVAEDSETGWVAGLVRRNLAENVSTVLGVPPTRVDLLVRLRSGKAPQTAQIPAPADGPAGSPALRHSHDVPGPR
ncbi:hypothetical protein [Citricoccus sp.]|uniref:hypothetical protein n=1 Tax=Citricoccus sp. TaxID=1978372 RepID=UPI0028BF2E40|nr:hypothetical protein [Citricoccus sp.]